MKKPPLWLGLLITLAAGLAGLLGIPLLLWFLDLLMTGGRSEDVYRAHNQSAAELRPAPPVADAQMPRTPPGG
jgi:hypothetical protein